MLTLKKEGDMDNKTKISIDITPRNRVESAQDIVVCKVCGHAAQRWEFDPDCQACGDGALDLKSG